MCYIDKVFLFLYGNTLKYKLCVPPKQMAVDLLTDILIRHEGMHLLHAQAYEGIVQIRWSGAPVLKIERTEHRLSADNMHEPQGATLRILELLLYNPSPSSARTGPALTELVNMTAGWRLARYTREECIYKLASTGHVEVERHNTYGFLSELGSESFQARELLGEIKAGAGGVRLQLTLKPDSDATQAHLGRA